ncbi:MAG: hemerythrin domain-containing protein [Desulfomonilaceae bacterium]
MKATEQLKAEHEGIKLMLGVINEICRRMDSGELVNVKHVESILEFLRVFVDQCHHGKEEEILFPALEAVGIPKEGGPIGQMLFEHQQGRRLVKEIATTIPSVTSTEWSSAKKFSQTSRKYIELLTQHIFKENQVLFAMADARLSEAEQGQLFDEFEKLEEQKIGLGKHEAFHKLLHDLTEMYTKADN